MLRAALRAALRDRRASFAGAGTLASLRGHDADIGQESMPGLRFTINEHHVGALARPDDIARGSRVGKHVGNVRDEMRVEIFP